MAGFFFFLSFFSFLFYFFFFFQSGICFRCRLDNPRRFPNFQLPTIGVTADFYILHFLEYHTSCIANYLLNMKSDTVPVEKETEHVSAFQQFIDSIRDDLFVNKKAFSMSFLLDKLCSFLPPNIASKYTTSKLQQRGINLQDSVIETSQGKG
jgi:hypothetical protein